MATLKPERFFLPVVRSHVQPDVKKTQVNVLHAFSKRTFNTPDATVPMGEMQLFEQAWDAYLKVFCKEGTREFLESLPYVGPDEAAVREWVSRLPSEKLKAITNEEGFGVEDLDLSRNTLMMKSKLKQEQGAAFATSVKAPQLIQYDPSRKSTATLSPIISRKVEIEQHVLKSNILILQRKSVEDIVRFLNRFDWRPDSRGVRYYVEVDESTFDKSQGSQASKLHWEKCAKFGVMPKYVQFLRDHNQLRSLSALEEGVKAFIDIQRGTGHPDTLDGNNDVSELALAELLLSILPSIEFIIVQGDDVIVAVRGPKVDIQIWESEVARRFNLSMKLAIHDHGYICSYDIVHLPDGQSVVVADIVKRALTFTSVSKNNEEFFEEQFVSFVDNMRYVDDMRVQNYLCDALPLRYASVLPGLTSEAVMLLCRALSTLKTDFKKFRAMFGSEKITRYY